MKQVNPYLTFNGQAEEAFTFYRTVFDGEFLSLSRFKDVPQDAGMEVVPGDEGRIMHVALPIGENTVLMGSDTPSSMDEVKKGNHISISVHPDTEEEAEVVFNALSEGGTVTMKLQKTFWNAYFGMCVDKFGVPWMVNFDYSTN